MDAPRKQNGFSDFIELQTGPERRAIDPAVLGEAAVWPLNDGQPDQGLCSGIHRAGFLERSRQTTLVADNPVAPRPRSLLDRAPESEHRYGDPGAYKAAKPRA